ncbi:MAG: patatin family protein [Coriobacteriales bacterium]
MGKVGIVDVGGGFRGIYACGVLDRCLEEGIAFDAGVGVSAGSANLCSFAAGQPGRNRRFYTDYGMRPQYASLRNLILKGSYIDLDYVYGTLSNSGGEDPIDQDAFFSSPMDFVVVACDAQTGGARYFTREDAGRDDFSILKASCAIPGVCRPCEVAGRAYFDGALADPVPVEKALSLGCDKVVLLLTRPRDALRVPGADDRLARTIQRAYPRAAEALRLRAQRYNEGVEKARAYELEGRVLIIAPDDTCGVSTLTRKRRPLEELYAKGREDAAALRSFL